ncbi:cupin domain-containing protein [Halogeometricum sp. S1BR25-6]|uniref:Cupin domain-containing protein n=1 Tax=Halogeometricum salsisoli TaxID=2950536 RepID=A0ABU2GFI5_9EURY|nr:cupin domain-containing protein [Halogeometricum sp. S1BR25-6]MDS0299547.1 cupin domain-containing protein [Halogeometricum sp. S1BR25-6]
MERVSTDDVESVEAVPDVHLSVLAGAERMNVQHFRIEPGATVPSHGHEQEQVGYLTAGELTFVLEDREVVVRAGDSYALGSEEVHAAENRGDETVEGVDIFSPPRTMADWGDE